MNENLPTFFMSMGSLRVEVNNTAGVRTVQMSSAKDLTISTLNASALSEVLWKLGWHRPNVIVEPGYLWWPTDATVDNG